MKQAGEIIYSTVNRVNSREGSVAITITWPLLRVVLETKVPEDFTITEKAPTSTFTFKTLLRHYAKRVLTPR